MRNRFPYKELFRFLYHDEVGEIIDNNLSAIKAGDSEIMRRNILRNQKEISYVRRILWSLVSRVRIRRTLILGISFSFLSLCNTRAILLAINGIFDVIGLFFVGGIICSIFNVPLTIDIGS